MAWLALSQVTTVRYLGVLISSRLGWKAHLDHISAKVKPRIGALRGLAKSERLPTETLIKLVDVFITAILVYACPAWSPSLSLSNLSRLTGIFINALRAAQDLPWDVPDADVLAAAMVEANVVPVTDRIECATNKWREECYNNKAYFRNLASQVRHHLESGLDSVVNSPFCFFQAEPPAPMATRLFVPALEVKTPQA
jgi:hypothetical protein